MVLFSALTHADEFDWNVSSISISSVEFVTESGSILVTVGSSCMEIGYCEVAAKFSYASDNGGTFVPVFQEMANDAADIKVVDNLIVISLIYYPRGSETGLRVERIYEWNAKMKTLELTRSTEYELEI